MSRFTRGEHNSGGLSNVILSRNDGWKKVKEILNSDNSGDFGQSTFQNDNNYTKSCHPELVSGSQKIAPSPAFQAPSPVGRGKRAAFTLAEVLITLGIIGVVAAMTMPTLMAKYQEKVTVNKMKKMYSLLSQAYNMYSIDHQPEKIEHSEEGAIKVYNIFKPYLKIAKDCGTASGTGCIYTGQYKSLKQNNTTIARYNSDTKYYKLLLADGSSIMLRGGSTSEPSNIYLEIFYDVNGEAAPNTWGKDLFEFDLAGNKIIPHGSNTESFEESCTAPDAAGWGCSAWVVFNENMDYLHCDGLSWNGKTSCK